MASRYPGQKKRPPPIEIPPPPPQRPVPGPNAFAIAAAQANLEGTRKPGKDSAGQRRPHTRDGGQPTPCAVPDTPLSTTSDNGNGPRLPRSHSATNKPRSSAMTAIANLMEQARSLSPSESTHSHPSANSRYGPPIRSRYSEQSHHGTGSGKARLRDASEEHPTLRGQLEAQSERKFFKMMGQVPGTPGVGAQPHIPESLVNTNDLRLDRGHSNQKPGREERAKSPKKKFFGMSLPTFRNPVSNAPVPAMPPKVAKVLGTSPPGKRRFTPRPIKSVLSSVPLRSSTSKSLPPKLNNQYAHHAYVRRVNNNYTVASRPRVRVASRRSSVQGAKRVSVARAEQRFENSPDSNKPPTPPLKDTPPDGKRARKTDVIRYKPFELPQEFHCEGENDIDTGMKLHLPLMPKLNPTPSGGSKSPTKFCPPAVEESVKIVDGSRIMSAYGEVESTDTNESEDDKAVDEEAALLEAQNREPFQTARLGQRNEWHNIGLNTFLKTLSDGSVQFQYLSPTVYEPPRASFSVADDNLSKQADNDRLLFAIPSKPMNSHTENPKRGSIGVIYQGEANDINPASLTGRMAQMAIETASTSQHPDENGGLNIANRAMPGIRADDQTSSLQNRKSPEHPQPEQSSSQLTEMLNNVTPSRASGFHDFLPHCPSAVPSPLNKAPGQPHPMVARRNAPPHVSNLPMSDHFFITNEHIDVVGCSIYDYVTDCSSKQIAAASSKHDHLLSILGQRFEDIKLQLNSTCEKTDHVANQNHNIGVHLDKLHEFLKSDLVTPLGIQAKKLADMEQSLMELQKAMQDLQKSVEQKNTAMASYSSPQNGVPMLPHSAPTTVFPLPNHRSQPSLAGYYDGPEPGREPVQQPPQSDMRRYGNNNYFGRPTYGRDSKDNGHPFSSTNPYHNGTAHFGSNFTGAIPPYGYPTSPDQQHYGFNHGPSK